MATVRDTVTGEVREGVTGDLLAYYRGEGPRFEVTETDASVPVFPMVMQPDASEPVHVEDPDDTDGVAAETQPDLVEQESPGTGEPMTPVEAPADGGPVEVGSTSLSLDSDPS